MAYKNPEMNKAVQKMKEAPRAIKITSGSSSTRESFQSSQNRSGSMTSSGLPRTTPGISTQGGRNVNPVYREGSAAPATLPKPSARGKAKNFTK